MRLEQAWCRFHGQSFDYKSHLKKVRKVHLNRVNKTSKLDFYIIKAKDCFFSKMLVKKSEWLYIPKM